VIMREEGNVRGLNTAATLWASAAVGACAGADLILEALLGTLFVLAANTLLRPIVNNINRQPLDVVSAEVTNILYVIARRSQQQAVMVLLEAELARCNYPASDVDVRPFGSEEVEIEATLAATSVDGDELDALVTRIPCRAWWCRLSGAQVPPTDPSWSSLGRPRIGYAFVRKSPTRSQDYPFVRNITPLLRLIAAAGRQQ